MTVVDSISHLRNLRLASPSVVTIGTFDGMHSGHRRLINRVITQANEQHANSIVVTFDLHPREFLNSDSTTTRILSTLPEKKKLLDNLKVDFAVVLPFAEIFNLSPESFVEEILFRHLKMK